MKAKYLLIIGLFVFSSCSKREETKVIAHRGYWDVEGSAQNSLMSLKKANEIGCYATEFDVWLTKDNKLIVNHDPTIDGKNITETYYSEIKETKLSNNESLPLLEDYLREAKNMDIRLVLELKPMKSDREITASVAIANMLKKYELVNRTDLISFSLPACKQLKYQLPECKVFYLNGDISPEKLHEMGFAGIDYQAKVLREHPEWIKESHDLRMEVNVWTVDNEDDVKYFIDKKVDYITTNKPLFVMNLIENK